MRRHQIMPLMLIVPLLLFAASCGSSQKEKGPSGGDERLQEARREASKAIEEAEVLLQGAPAGTDLSDARELLDQARALYDQALSPEQLTGKEGSALQLVEEAKKRAREAMQARSGQ